ncbi:MAG: DUF4390 domain-containing protein [Burkholderiales bacterium]
MTVSSTRCCRRRARHNSGWLIGALVALWLALAGSVTTSQAQGIEVKTATVILAEDGYVVDAQFEIALTHTLEEVLNKGVPLYFRLEFELIRPRWYWLNERLVNLQQDYRLSFNALTRQYRLGAGNLHQNFSSLSEALEVMSRVRRRHEVEPGTFRRGNTYAAAIRMRLDTAQLPKPFQLNALGAREWYIGSDWARWTVAF